MTDEAQLKHEKEVATHVPTSAFVAAKQGNIARSQQQPYKSDNNNRVQFFNQNQYWSSNQNLTKVSINFIVSKVIQPVGAHHISSCQWVMGCHLRHKKQPLRHILLSPILPQIGYLIRVHQLIWQLIFGISLCTQTIMVTTFTLVMVLIYLLLIRVLQNFLLWINLLYWIMWFVCQHETQSHFSLSVLLNK